MIERWEEPYYLAVLAAAKAYVRRDDDPALFDALVAAVESAAAAIDGPSR